MNWKKLAFAACWVAVLLLSAVATSGCGGAGGSDLIAMFGSMQENLRNADSYRMVTSMTTSVDFSGNLEAFGAGEDESDTWMRYDMLYEESGGEPFAKLSAEFPKYLMAGMAGTDGQLEEVEAYINAEEIFYQETTGGPWIYEEFDEGEDFFAVFNKTAMSPLCVMQTLDDYEDIEIVEENDAYVVYRLVVDYWVAGITDPMYENMEMVVKVDRRLNLPTEIELTKKGNLAEMGAIDYIEEPGIAAMMKDSTYSFVSYTEFSDYGSDFDITIPQEALDARP